METNTTTSSRTKKRASPPLSSSSTPTSHSNKYDHEGTFGGKSTSSTTAKSPPQPNHLQKKNKRSSIKILILGDEGVGKSSLISTYVSRHFSNVAPGTMTRVRLPPDPTISNGFTIGGGGENKSIITTIMDSNAVHADAALMDAIDQDFSNIINHPNSDNVPHAKNGSGCSSVDNGDDASSLTDSMRSYPQTGEAAPGGNSSSGSKNSDNDDDDGSNDTPLMLESNSSSTSSFSTSSVERGHHHSHEQEGRKINPTVTTNTAPYSQRNQWNTIMNRENVERNVNFGNGVDHVDCIVLVYDLDRIETFRRMEKHWLPLIERCYYEKLPVIIAGSKLDLLETPAAAGTANASTETPSTSIDQSILLRSSHRQIVALLQRFKFVRQCIKFSAKKLINVDEIILKAQHAVLYPITPALYDLDQACLAKKCKQAVTRIFRMYDVDHDGLLSSMEVNAFQKHALNVRLGEQDFAGWRKVISKNARGSDENNSQDETKAVVQDGKFTVTGFMAIFDLFIGQNRLDVAWKMLRVFGFDDDLNLYIPRHIYKSSSTSRSGGSSWTLTSSARLFLTSLFHQFDSDNDGILSPEDLKEIFWVLPGISLPPWHPQRSGEVFKGSYSRPMFHSKGRQSLSDNLSSLKSGSFSSYSTGGITICSAGSLEDNSNSIGNMIDPLDFNEWMGYWHMMSAMSPAQTRAELYRLGHIEDATKIGLLRPREMFTPVLPSSAIRVFVIGKAGCGKSNLINYFRTSNYFSHENESRNDKFNDERDMYSLISSVAGEAETSFTWINSQSQIPYSSSEGKSIGEMTDHFSYFIFTEISVEGEDDIKKAKEKYSLLKKQIFGVKKASHDINCDLVMLVFHSSDANSLSYVQTFEKAVLNDEIPRIYVCNNSKKECFFCSKDEHENIIEMSLDHCKEFDLEPPIMVATDNDNGRSRIEILKYLCDCMDAHSVKVTPHGEKKRREAQKRMIMKWFGGFVGTGLVIAISMRLFVNRTKTDVSKEGKDCSFPYTLFVRNSSK